MLVNFGKANLIDKARQQPDKVAMVIDKVRTDGVSTTFAAVRNKLDQPLALGYCNVGHVVEVGRGVTGFEVGDRVASNGQHAEIVTVPTNLCAKVPAGIDDDSASFTVLAAISLQGIRLAGPSLGETFVVTGLGLIGLITVQLLRAHGCNVIGLDFSPDRLDLAERFGAKTVNLATGADPVEVADKLTSGSGVDGVIVTASTQSSEPIHQAALMCRKRGRIILVGVTGLELSRADFYEKELTFQVSCSYGPGRYDSNYELKGLDYPIGFVRWTEQRNFEAILDMLSDRRLDVASLISHRFDVSAAEKAYETVSTSASALGVVLAYPDEDVAPLVQLRERTLSLLPSEPQRAVHGSGKVGVAVIGSGNYATNMLIPALRDAGAKLMTVASSGGVSGRHAGRKFGFARNTTDIGSILADPSIDVVAVTTRHNSHARLVVDALDASKSVFVEKPLALTHSEVDDVQAAYRRAVSRGETPYVMVGFNRRFAPHVVRMKSLLEDQVAPKAMIVTVNVGALPSDHWTQDKEIGGGRIVGEACHFIDLLRFLAGSPIENHHVQTMVSETADTVTIILGFADGSTGTIHYFANGHKAFPKERIEVFVSGRILQLDNYRRLTGQGWKGTKTMRSWRQDKGQSALAAGFIEAVAAGSPPPIPFAEIMEVSRVAIDVAEAAEKSNSGGAGR